MTNRRSLTDDASLNNGHPNNTQPGPASQPAGCPSTSTGPGPPTAGSTARAAAHSRYSLRNQITQAPRVASSALLPSSLNQIRSGTDRRTLTRRSTRGGWTPLRPTTSAASSRCAPSSAPRRAARRRRPPTPWPPPRWSTRPPPLAHPSATSATTQRRPR